MTVRHTQDFEETYSLGLWHVFPRHWGDGVSVSDGLFEAIDMKEDCILTPAHFPSWPLSVTSLKPCTHTECASAAGPSVQTHLCWAVHTPNTLSRDPAVAQEGAASPKLTDLFKDFKWGHMVSFCCRIRAVSEGRAVVPTTQIEKAEAQLREQSKLAWAQAPMGACRMHD